MNWDDLKFLLHVSRSPILTDASDKLGLDATTISRRLKRLEEELGLTLFERTRRGHILSPEGLEIARRAEQMEQSVIEVAAYAEAESQIAGRVRLGVTEGFGTYFIAPHINNFTQQHPAINLDLIAMSGYANVSKREADLAIMLTRPQKGRLKVRKLTDYELCLYASQDYIDSHSPIRHPSDLNNHKLIGYMDELLYSPQLNYYDDVSPGLTPELCSPSIVAQLHMTRSGAGAAILPRFMANTHPDLIQLLPEAINIKRSFWLVIHEDVHTLARVKALNEFLTQLVQTHARQLKT